ncbi:MAG: hypothetical protein QOI71_1113 [Gaiellales bacterium]|nr:hypothetical protein [Gaiellales bacterium]
MIGVGNSCVPGRRSALRFPSGACSASSRDPRGDGRGRPELSARNCDASPCRPACGAASRRINSATPTRSRWPLEGVPLNVIQRQLGHTDLGVTSVYLRGIDNAEIIDAIHARKPPMMPASAGLRL